MENISKIMVDNYSRSDNISFNLSESSFGELNMNNKEKMIKKNNTEEGKRIANAVQNDKSGIYVYRESEFGDSLELGSNNENHANAFTGGASYCPVDLTIPRTLIDEKGVKKKVEVIGQYAFYSCSCMSCTPRGNTKRITLTRNIKVIKKYGLGGMNDLEYFEIEEGSVLQSVDQYGLHAIGINTGRNKPAKRGILTLPSSLSSVAADGIYRCNLFKIIVYCGPNSLIENCEVDNGVSEQTVMKVTSQYPQNTSLFGRDPKRSTEEEAEADSQCDTVKEIPIIPDFVKDKCAAPNKILSVVLMSCVIISNYDSENSGNVNTEVLVIVKKRKKIHMRDSIRSWCNEHKALKTKNYFLVSGKTNRDMRKVNISL